MKPWERFGPQKKPWEMTASELQARIDAAPIGSVGAPGGVQPAESMGRGQTGPSVSDALLDPEFWTRDIPRNLSDQLPAIGGLAAGLSVPGLGLGALAAGAGAGAGSIVDSAVGDLMDPGGRPRLDLGKAGTEAAVTAGTTLAVGGLFRGLFGKGTADDIADKAIDYAKANKAPALPPGTRAKLTLGTGKATVAGGLQFEREAARVSQAIDDEIVGMGPATSADDIVEAARVSLKDALDPRKGFKAIHELIPKELPIPIANTLQGMRDAIPRLAQTGDDALTAKVTTILQSNADDAALSFDRVDGLITELQKLRTPANSEVLDDVITGLKSDVAASVGADEALSESVDAAGGVMELFKKAGQEGAGIRKLLQDVPVLRSMMKEGVTPGSFLAKFSNSESARNAIKKYAPELHDELSKAWLARNADRFLSDGKMNGQGFARFLSENQKAIKSMFGVERFEALGNFSAYVRYMGDIAKTGTKSADSINSPLLRLGRLGAEASALGIPGALAVEGGGAAVVNRLMTPGSGLFQLFAEGAGKAAVPAGVIAGQAGQGIVEELR